MNSKHRAVVRYVGTTNFAEGIWYGLELEREIGALPPRYGVSSSCGRCGVCDAPAPPTRHRRAAPPAGKHTGTVLGTTYFVAPTKRGTFVRRDTLSRYDPALEAAARIQASVRGRSAQKKVAREVTWRAFSTLDADEEAQLLQRRARLMSSALGARLNRERPEPSELDAYEAEAARMVVDPSYDGPHLTWPLTEDQIVRMIGAFRDGKRLHYRYGAALLGGYRRLASALPTLVYADISEGTRVTVCGDTHGQLADLYSIFTLNGLPSPVNRYLMNGDFVDRGEGACEILFTLFAYALLYPGEFGSGRGAAMLINRGNHESGNQNVTGGFMLEVLDKYSAPGGTGDPEVRRGRDVP